MEHPPVTVRVATADSAEHRELADIAAQTFPLAGPPTMDPRDVAAFIEANLSALRFAEYLRDPDRAVLTARRDQRIVGYAMVVRGATGDDDVQRVVTARPVAELSKMYVLPDCHRSGVATALMGHALAIADQWGARSVWLGVNQTNERAQRFYAASGFAIAGTRTFRVGTRLERDYVMVRGDGPG